MEKEEFKQLAEKIHQGTASAEEIATYNYYYALFQKDTEWKHDKFGDQQLIGNDMYNRIDEIISENKKGDYTRWIAVAATIAIIFAAAFYFYRPSTSDQFLVSKLPERIDISPGSDKAILTLADGSTIELDQIANGAIAEQGSVRISKSKDGSIVYEVESTKNIASIPSSTFNTISTPRGGQYKVILPDGSQVWLNAGSTLRYPTSFTMDKRKVELTGEAYFEVASKTRGGNRVPFIVATANQEVEVLGTVFNISSYAEDKTTKTTLLEGSVRIHVTSPHHATGENQRTKSILLKPNQQSTLLAESNKLFVDNVNTEGSVAWKNGLFIFDDESLRSIMNKISRWYDVDVVFKGADPDRIYWGSVSRFKNVSEVLDKLELTGSVKFKIEDFDGQGKERRIVVMK